MNWKAESLARARRARLQANNLRHSIDNLEYSLHSLGGYDDKCALLTDVVDTINGVVRNLFEIEEKLSRVEE